MAVPRSEWDPRTTTSLHPDDLPDRYAFCDPAGGKSQAQLKKIRARSANIVVAQDWLARYWILYANAHRNPTSKLVEEILTVAERYNPKVYGIEANAMQALFADLVIRDALHRGTKVPIVPVYQPTKVDKKWRIRTTLQPLNADGRLIFGQDQKALIDEFKAFPMTQTFDLVDALTSAIKLAPKVTPKQARNSEYEALASYLRHQGVSPHEIQARLADLSGDVSLTGRVLDETP
jgi:predicted phage terminase large subunit-like protein